MSNTVEFGERLAHVERTIEQKLSDNTIQRLEIIDELRKSGKLGKMIDNGALYS